ncbi:hypothetical protein [Corynebacterium halotolerans]|uniref:Uncharacterized protein n=1 Tax=Corynebacterium halotolerans YIM 70093 = DSM 44683 TaxID=1121362 RepID=M1NM74_9CORY|nr:hypothetical protein [Corynebacterium halotolerans]AGF72463.1 hypothetical protein A605_07305 [Corynebacterium halotolerans YIM 70093 = DSM 44683]
MPDNAESIRNHLIEAFPVWVRAAADESGFHLGEAMKFSATRFFFPDCTVPVGGDIYIGNQRLSQIRVPLFIDSESVIDDLLDHEPGSFSLADGVAFVSSWKVATPDQAQDCLWYALDSWFMTFAYAAEFEVGMRERNLEDCTDFP